jgi:hypothetical protein
MTGLCQNICIQQDLAFSKAAVTLLYINYIYMYLYSKHLRTLPPQEEFISHGNRRK